MIGFVLSAWGWFRASRLGQIAAAVGAALLALFIARQSGKRAARHEARVEDMEDALDVHERADEALRRADGDTRPVDDRLRSKNRLRD